MSYADDEESVSHVTIHHVCISPTEETVTESSRLASAAAASTTYSSQTQEGSVDSKEIEDNTAALGYARFLYLSYFFAAWGDRMWEFAGVIFLLDLFPDTLLPSSVFGLVETIAGIVGSSYIGAFIDRCPNRLLVIRISVLMQNVAIAIAGVCFFISLRSADEWSDREKWYWFGALGLCACFARWASSMNKIALHKDWIVVLAGGNSAVQSKLNARMRSVDLFCSIVAPLAVGIVSSLTSSAVASISISGWSFGSLFVEWILNQHVYDRLPILKQKRTTPSSPQDVPPKSSLSEPLVEADSSPSASPSAASWSPLQTFVAYVRHPVFLASFGYCMLYVSCLSFGGIMIAYLKTLGLSDAWLAAGRAIAALVGISATVATPYMIKRWGMLRSGFIAVWLQLLCLLPLLLIGFLFLSEHSTIFMVVVFVTICSSRFGLWSFDLVETQLMQEMVEKSETGRINGAQEALMNVGYLCSFVLTIVFSDPAHFLYPAIASVAAVGVCAVSYTCFILRTQEPSTANVVHD